MKRKKDAKDILPADEDQLAFGPQDECDARMRPAQKKARVMSATGIGGIDKIPRAGDATADPRNPTSDVTTGANASRQLRIDPATRHLDK